ncbi:hypothetical protein AUEXF2481DRAFT_2789 [Aureobasidium subglaciale EXF-2481]|uniref:Peptidase M43 pregnancy-associated plasma-A domain-containing protein n=1 Tax=Aureobasidium subglaciale (strain EXF-2481) TaxID=1043005 RepID=A0A074YJ82_AURSE|nr:uncharacterized protein AUEXF2481DRAFT_2789 [Aureobasidium subglaciale EXF-2481]KAI5204385.1 hypothetical protein E4T38_04708 [Aureobasidium subglaciale]KAI5223074.1 hypothetical protein E4T40_04694 [Aureobasidium subglaciale]KAI5226738.1 hypothetical protein E4T41_04637 [Aureobasidium subglaciale]KAI5262345.1 hypothetical protein E4T46_04523 [Aureobasidium subglaciale]KEQ97878.1 hypothetical protein AUEXF2481DRAFT_2789 [Aureobasidium subglaciale EXF-2481]
MKVSSLLTLVASVAGALAYPNPAYSISFRDLIRRAEGVPFHEDPKATTWNPPPNMVAALDWVWKRSLLERSTGRDLTMLGALVKNNGILNYCVSWPTDEPITFEQRSEIVTALQSSWQQWIDVLVGFEGFPLTTVDVNVMDYAVKDKALVQGDTTGLTIHTIVDPSDGLLTCGIDCNLFGYSPEDYDVSRCSEGKTGGYDTNFRLEQILDQPINGAVTKGQSAGPLFHRFDQEHFFDNLRNEWILLHELGHAQGLRDFYEERPVGQINFLMYPDSAHHLTEFDAWMLRDWYMKLKQRGDF